MFCPELSVVLKLSPSSYFCLKRSLSIHPFICSFNYDHGAPPPLAFGIQLENKIDLVPPSWGSQLSDFFKKTATQTIQHIIVWLNGHIFSDNSCSGAKQGSVTRAQGHQVWWRGKDFPERLLFGDLKDKKNQLSERKLSSKCKGPEARGNITPSKT